MLSKFFKRFFKVVGFTGLAAVYPHLVDYAVKVLLSAGSMMWPNFINAWYDGSHNLIAQIPVVGPQLLALIRTWMSDGSMVFWEVWFGLAIPITILGWIFGAFRHHQKKPKLLPRRAT